MADYNGWKNWETWNVNLHLDNEESTYRRKVAFLKRSTRRITATAARTFVEMIFPRGTSDMRSDEDETVSQQMAKVDWKELAEHMEIERKELRAC